MFDLTTAELWETDSSGLSVSHLNPRTISIEYIDTRKNADNHTPGLEVSAPICHCLSLIQQHITQKQRLIHVAHIEEIYQHSISSNIFETLHCNAQKTVQQFLERSWSQAKTMRLNWWSVGCCVIHRLRSAEKDSLDDFTERLLSREAPLASSAT